MPSLPRSKDKERAKITPSPSSWTSKQSDGGASGSERERKKNNCRGDPAGNPGLRKISYYYLYKLLSKFVS